MRGTSTCKEGVGENTSPPLLYRFPPRRGGAGGSAPAEGVAIIARARAQSDDQFYDAPQSYQDGDCCPDYAN